MITADQAAIRILLSNKPEAQRKAELQALAKRVSDIVNNKVECPSCGHKGPHEDNGQTGINLSYMCAGCFAQFDAEDA